MSATFRLLPQGNFPLIPTVLTTMAWLSSLFQDDCDYSRVHGDIVQLLATSPDTPWLEVGIKAYREPKQNMETKEWEVTYSGPCLAYPQEYVDTQNDSAWKAATAFSFLALVLGGGATFFLWFSTCCTFSKGTWRWAGYEVFLAFFFQACSFVFFRTQLCQQNDCELYFGSRSDIVATVFWLVGSLCILCYYPQPKDETVNDGLMIDPNQPSVPVPLDSHDLALTEVELNAGAAASTKPEHAPNEPVVVRETTMAPGEDSRQGPKTIETEIV